MSESKTGLQLLREPFKHHQISKLPKPTKAQTDEVKRDFKKGIRCDECGGWHHPKVVHLDYVGHAALTDRLLDCDPEWNWEPLTFSEAGGPLLDGDGGMWIKLTVCKVTRLGYGDAQGKVGPNATKERIGDALRNAAMRFGAALDLWHKGELTISDSEEASESSGQAKEEVKKEALLNDQQLQQLYVHCTFKDASGALTFSPIGMAIMKEYNVDGMGQIPASKFPEVMAKAYNLAKS